MYSKLKMQDKTRKEVMTLHVCVDDKKAQHQHIVGYFV
jgi:hypothetical protein